MPLQIKCFGEIRSLSEFVVTAPGKKVDFVLRMFAPGIGIDEDQVTGATHTGMIPYWSKKLGKT